MLLHHTLKKLAEEKAKQNKVIEPEKVEEKEVKKPTKKAKQVGDK